MGHGALTHTVGGTNSISLAEGDKLYVDMDYAYVTASTFLGDTSRMQPTRWMISRKMVGRSPTGLMAQTVSEKIIHRSAVGHTHTNKERSWRAAPA